ncbi:MAG: selenocysteine synthase [bacterium]|nr:selenocysteine synthase [bacterium]
MTRYGDLGIRPFINACGTITTLGGSLMPPEVLDAMREAAGAFVDVPELNVKAGEYLSRRIGVEAAFISCGAASGMQLAAAACLTGTDEEKVRALPHTEGWKNEFVISLVDAHTYIHQGIEVCGGKLVRVGSKTEVHAKDLVGGITEKTAAVVHFLGKQSKEQLGEVVEGAAKKGVPVIVDAAAQLPPRSNLTEIPGMGASLVVFSGGKGLRGPQSAGLVLGKKEFVDAVRLNASPFSAIGRGMKVGKEEIMGLVAAVDRFLKGKDEEDRLAWEWQASCVVTALKDVPGVKAYVLRDGQEAAPSIAPRAYVDLEPDRAKTVIQAMREGDPPVVMRRSATGVMVDPMTLMPGEEETVARRLLEVLSQ